MSNFNRILPLNQKAEVQKNVNFEKTLPHWKVTPVLQAFDNWKDNLKKFKRSSSSIITKRKKAKLNKLYDNCIQINSKKYNFYRKWTKLEKGVGVEVCLRLVE